VWGFDVWCFVRLPYWFLWYAEIMMCIVKFKYNKQYGVNTMSTSITSTHVLSHFLNILKYFLRTSGSENRLRTPNRDPNVRISGLRMTSLFSGLNVWKLYRLYILFHLTSKLFTIKVNVSKTRPIDPCQKLYSWHAKRTAICVIKRNTVIYG
jgi:hypothetical protein